MELAVVYMRKGSEDISSIVNMEQKLTKKCQINILLVDMSTYHRNTEKNLRPDEV